MKNNDTEAYAAPCHKSEMELSVKLKHKIKS